MTDSKPHNDPEWLRQKYLEEEHSQYDIADMCSVSRATISRRLDKFGIPTRSIAEGARTNSPAKLRDEEWLREKYIEESCGASEIAEMADTTNGTVWQWLQRHGIPTRSLSEAKRQGTPSELKDEATLREMYNEQWTTTHDIADRLDVDQKTVLNWMDRHGIERERPDRNRHPDTPEELRNEGWLRKKHFEEKLNITEIAQEVDADRSTVYRWMRIHGVEPQGLSGEYSHMWKGGISDTPAYYGATWNRQREKALNRDSRVCQICGMDEEEHRNEHGIGLDVHHIRPLREFDDKVEGHELYNLITLCRGCHAEAEPDT